MTASASFYARYAGRKAELFDGSVRLMTGAAQRRNEIVGNLFAELHVRV